jgi:ssDNA-binding Zn-finger/Zn-ribbon topoisomerase 1
MTEVDLPCPKCGHKMRIALSELQAGGMRACPSCATTIKFSKVKVNVNIKSKRPWWKFWGA